MIARGRIAGCLIAAALLAGTISDRVPQRAPVMIGRYRVLAADLHVHTFPFAAGTIAPWDIPFEAQRQGLDVVAVAGHNEILSGRAGRWFSQLVGGPTIFASEEIHGPRFHMIALGIHDTISWRLSASDAIDEIHRQGGLAIAAHPVSGSWPAYDNDARAKLDAVEVVQPIIYAGERERTDLETFWRMTGRTAIGSTDYHGMSSLGLCRTYIFARDASEVAIVEALRADRTVVFDGARVYGDPALTGLATESQMRGASAPYGVLGWISGIAGALGLLLAATTIERPLSLIVLFAAYASQLLHP